MRLSIFHTNVTKHDTDTVDQAAPVQAAGGVIRKDMNQSFIDVQFSATCYILSFIAVPQWLGVFIDVSLHLRVEGPLGLECSQYPSLAETKLGYRLLFMFMNLHKAATGSLKIKSDGGKK